MAKNKKNGRVAWSEDEVKLLKRLFPRGRAREIAEQTGRPLTAVRQKAYNMGIKTRERHLWSANEIKLLKKLYTTPGRTHRRTNAVDTRTILTVSACSDAVFCL